jgi:hypothetical protein
MEDSLQMNKREKRGRKGIGAGDHEKRLKRSGDRYI